MKLSFQLSFSPFNSPFSFIKSFCFNKMLLISDNLKKKKYESPSKL